MVVNSQQQSETAPVRVIPGSCQYGIWKCYLIVMCDVLYIKDRARLSEKDA